jgi:hypothetical protein
VSEKLSPAPETLRSFRNDDSMTPIGTTMLHHAMPCYAMLCHASKFCSECLRLSSFATSVFHHPTCVRVACYVT